MGFFFSMKSLALVEDLGLEAELHDKEVTREQFYQIADNAFNANATNCLIAAGLYVLTFLISLHQFYLNSRSSRY